VDNDLVGRYGCHGNFAKAHRKERTSMNPTTSQRNDGTFAATVSPAFGQETETCVHSHSNEAAAAACGNWEARAVSKGETRWHAPKTPRSAKRVLDFAPLAVGETVGDDDLAHSHEYIPMPELAKLWHAVVTGAKSRPATNLMFLGPSGSGKTDGARYLAALVGLPFTKVDSASMTDPEAWFGTREIVVQDGVAVTEYRPSEFVQALGKPGVMLIDEINRVRDEHRNVLLPLLDATRAVTNPLTGDVVARHPQCFVIMAGNVGLHFTGTNAIDPAFMTRALTVEFEYIDTTNETRIVQDASGCSVDDATVFVRFAGETRAKALIDPEFLPISTRELIEAGRLVKDGLSRDLAVQFVVLNGASAEGGASSLRQELKNIWNGVRLLKAEVATPAAAAGASWFCVGHPNTTPKHVPAGVSALSGKSYNAFDACSVTGCPGTSDRPVAATAGKVCPDCHMQQAIGRTSYCANCGATLR
jgi:MoxR-like ATPase